MKVPIKWLKDFVDINCDIDEYAHLMTMSGSKVEAVTSPGAEIENVLVGRITALSKHPDADKLQVCKVDLGGGREIRIITGAQNVAVGNFIPAAVAPANLPEGIKIVKGKLRGLESEGMMCSIQELGVTKAEYPNACEDGIFILEDDLDASKLVLGEDIRNVLGLNDATVEFEITPNRPDCLSVYGIARETAVTLGTQLRKLEIQPAEHGDDASSHAAVEVENATLCPRYTARVIKDVKVKPSPAWMQERLAAAGVRPINNIVDITNYVMLELGQPMHAFDLANLKGRKIVVRNPRDGEIIRTLDGQERALEPWMLVIADAEKPVAVAGVMGGENSEITADTREMLLESAIFDRSTVRLTARRLGMRTEASSRFEKGLDSQTAILAANRAAQLIEETGSGVVCKGIIDIAAPQAAAAAIKLDPARINALLGTDISTDEMFSILKSLEFETDEKAMTVTPPHFRTDVEMEADLAEEIARFYGYNKIVPTLLQGKATTRGSRSPAQKTELKVRGAMLAAGLSEIYTYSFTSKKNLDLLNLPEGDPLRAAIEISNPLGEDFKLMRTTTLPSMLEALSLNFNRRAEAAGLFEISHTYGGTPDAKGAQPARETKTLTVGMYGPDADFYKLKGMIEALFEELRIKKYEFEPLTDSPVFHPGRAAVIKLGREKLGVAGEIHPAVAENFSAPARTYAAEIDLDAVFARVTDKVPQYKPLPRFPAVTRDMALIVGDAVMAKDIEAVAAKFGGAIIEEVKLFDFYKGPQVPENMKSIAYSLVFRAADRTLTDEEVNKVMSEIISELEKRFGAKLR